MMKTKKGKLKIDYEFENGKPKKGIVEIEDITPIELMTTMATIIKELSNSKKETRFDIQAFTWFLFDDILESGEELEKPFVSNMLKANLKLIKYNGNTI